MLAAFCTHRQSDRFGRASREKLARSLLCAQPIKLQEGMATVLVDLKRRIRGDFYIIDEDDDKIVLGNRACPFAEKVSRPPKR